ncbi:MAG: hypothetical protein LBS24_01680 [Clostridiales Family XIII bacterium]|jgi:hypothetical protein|nr:hypothetical protein [Clostridiales Family XIII bacterium]
MKHAKSIAILLLLCLAATALAGCKGKPEYDAEGNLIIPDRVKMVMDRALERVKSAGNSLNGKFANWHRDMIASGLEHNYSNYDKQFSLLDSARSTTRARNIYLLYDYDAADDAYIISLYASKKPLPFGAPREATHAIREAFAGRGTVELFAWEYANDDLVWSAFTPVYDENAEIIAVLGLDLPAPAILEFPEWNRDSRRWNGLTE